MSKQVPETANAAPEFTPANLAKLLGNRSFARQRGWLSPLLPFIESIIQNSPFLAPSPFYCQNPSQIPVMLEKVLADLRPLLAMMIRARNNGENDFLKQLIKALTTPDYLMPFETWEDSQTIMITAYILDPDKTIPLMRWLCHSDMEGLRKHVQGSQPERCSTPQEADDLLRAMPSLAKSLDRALALGNENEFYFGVPVQTAYCEDVIRPHLAFLKRLPRSAETSRDLWVRRHPAASHPHGMIFGVNRFNPIWKNYKEKHIEKDAILADAGRFLVRIHFGPPHEIKTLLPRKEQDNIATWTFKVPKAFIPRHYTEVFSVRIYDASGHGSMATNWPMFASNRCSHGLGMTFVPGNELKGREIFRDIKFLPLETNLDLVASVI